MNGGVGGGPDASTRAPPDPGKSSSTTTAHVVPSVQKTLLTGFDTFSPPAARVPRPFIAATTSRVKPLQEFRAPPLAVQTALSGADRSSDRRRDSPGEPDDRYVRARRISP